VRFESDGHVLVIDPGVWSDPEALVGADAVLVTHEHSDHVDVEQLAGDHIPVYAPASGTIEGLQYDGLTPGDVLEVAGFDVAAVGGQHARVVDDQETIANLGYVINATIYHPGDSLYVPDQPIDTAFVPMQASWLKTSEAISFLDTVLPSQAVGIHDGQLKDHGRDSVNHWLGQACDGYRWVPPGTVL
jgi:L-ascorbate metabolism protein UlaG (beta-lactamase superfamily)